MKTLLLDAVKWDLVKDVSGNIALASEPYIIMRIVADGMLTRAMMEEIEASGTVRAGRPLWD